VPRIKNIPGPYRFFFYSLDCNEPKHIHVRREIMHCKFWLEPVSLAANHHFSTRELDVIRSYIERHRSVMVEAWDEHCG
jgi:hypothetical protein